MSKNKKLNKKKLVTKATSKKGKSKTAKSTSVGTKRKKSISIKVNEAKKNKTVKPTKSVSKAKVKKSPLPKKNTPAKKIDPKNNKRSLVKTSLKNKNIVLATNKRPSEKKEVKTVLKQVKNYPDKLIKKQADIKERSKSINNTRVAKKQIQVSQNTEEELMNTPPGKFELEYVVHSSAELLFNFLTEPSGLSEWFCDDVNIRHGIYTFFWDGVQQQAKELKFIPEKLARFQWLEKTDGSYFEFRIEKDDLTGDISLLITDFAETEDERNSSKLLWDSQIDKLLHVLGAYF